MFQFNLNFPTPQLSIFLSYYVTCYLKSFSKIVNSAVWRMKFKLDIKQIVAISLCINFVYSQSYYDDSPEGRRRAGNRRRPCVFRPKLKNHQGRTFLDWNIQQYDISYNYNYNIDCSGGSGGSSNNGPGLLGSHFQGGGLLGSHNRPGGGGLLGSLFNKPQGGLINNIPGIPEIGNGISQSQSQTQAVSDESSNNPFGSLNPNRPILSGVGSLIGNIPNNPVAEGIGSIGEGIGSILQIIPQTFQSFTSSQSSSGGFFPQGILSSFGSLFSRPPSSGSVLPATNGQVPQVTTPSDPDDIIYNDETATPVNTNYDPVPDAYNVGGRPGRPGRPRPGIYYNPNSYYNKLSPYSLNRGY